MWSGPVEAIVKSKNLIVSSALEANVVGVESVVFLRVWRADVVEKVVGWLQQPQQVLREKKCQVNEEAIWCEFKTSSHQLFFSQELAAPGCSVSVHQHYQLKGEIEP